jgi:hypothetical protein
MRRMGYALVVLLMAVMVCPCAFAAISGAATITGEQQIGPGQYEYTVSLTNNGDTDIRTLWFGWIVYFGNYVYDLMPHQATNVTGPTGWVGTTAQDGLIGGVYSVQWYSNTPLSPGQTLSGFKFDSTDAPGVINGTSSFAGYPVREGWVYQNVYSGIFNSGAGNEVATTIAPAPEPTAVLLLPSLLLLRRYRARAR